MEIKRVGVVGCGSMGAGIVQTCAQHNLEVVVTDATQKALDAGIAGIDALMSKKVKKQPQRI